MFEDTFKKYMNYKNITFCLIVLTFLFFIFKCKDIAVMFFASYVIACSINPLVDKLSAKLPRRVAANIITAGILILILAIFIPICILSVEQVSILMNKLPKYIDNFDEYIFSLPLFQHFNFFADNADNFMEQISMSSSDLLSQAVNIGTSISKALVYLVVSMIIIFNLVSDKINIENYCLKAFPSNIRKRAKEVGHIISAKMGGYLIALIAASFCVGVVMFAGLLILKVPYALLLSVLSGILDIIPIVGPALALIICLVTVYESGTTAVISVIAVFALAQFIENNAVRPYIFSKVMNVHPIVIFLFLFIAAEYIGFMGVIFAPALAALVAVLFEELYLKKLN